MRIVILTSETPANIWLVNQLTAQHDVAAIVVESRPLASTRKEKHERRWKMVQRHGVLKTLNKLAYNWYRSRRSHRSGGDTVVATLFGTGRPLAYPTSISISRVANINDSDCAQVIRREAPDLLAVCGTSVIREHIFTLATNGAINIHTGITPQYRSADPIFWALYNNDPGNIGVTIHYVDKGIDTGSIIHQERVPVYAEDTLDSIYVRCVQAGARLYTRAIQDIESGTVTTLHRPNAISRAFYSIDLGLVQYLLFLWRFRRMTSRLPKLQNRQRASETVV